MNNFFYAQDHQMILNWTNLVWYSLLTSLLLLRENLFKNRVESVRPFRAVGFKSPRWRLRLTSSQSRASVNRWSFFPPHLELTFERPPLCFCQHWRLPFSLIDEL
jgi:hypothetical protein